MRKLVIILIAVLAITGTFIGCNTPVADEDNATYGWSQRPQFIETRPAEEVEKVTLRGEYLDKGKPTGGTTGDTLGPDPNPNPAHKYAYIVGISNYEGTQNDLQYCDDDATDWKNYLQGQGFTIRIDLDLQATAANIQAGLNWLKTSAQPGDEIMFCYSGHGNKTTTNGSCLVSADLYYVANSLVAQYIQGANCTKKMVAIDACYAGDFVNVGGANSLCSTASTTTYSYDGTAQMANGVWTYYFMYAVNNLGKIYGEEASSYAETQMKAWGSANRARVSPSHKDNYTGGGFDM